MNSPTPIYPPALKPGDKIGVIAPSSIHDVDSLSLAVEFLKNKGFEVVLHPQIHKQHGQFAGTDEEKLHALHEYFSDSSINAIFCTRGGNGCIHLLNKIDYSIIQQNPKIFLGYSDITSLLHAIYQKTGLITFHGPVLSSLSRPKPTNRIEPKWLEQMLTVLTGQSDSLDLPDAGDTKAEGTLYGGNLSVLQTLIGTPYTPDMSNAILFLEDVGDHLSRYDRMIGHMKQAGWFNDLSALMIGEFLNTQDNPNRPFGFNVEEILQNNAPNTPTITNAPIGHGQKLCTLPIGAKVTLKNGTLSFKPLV